MRSLADKFGIPLSDSDLAKLGVLAALEAKAKFLIMVTLKAVAALDQQQFVALERLQLGQLTKKVLETAPAIDSELTGLVEEFERRREQDHELRHKYVHALWGSGEGDDVVARDIRRAETLTPAELDGAMEKVAVLARAGHACALRTAQLIFEGRLPEGAGKINMYVGGRWVTF
jgi:hypothetical protein